MNLRNVLFIFLIGFLGRVLPHPENIAPLHALCVLTGFYLPKRAVLYGLWLSCFCADVFIAFNNDFPIWGSWSFYTYTGMLGLVYLGKKMREKNLQAIFALSGSLGFWLWTNLGVWLHSGIYLKTIPGFIACYVAAIPFLHQAMLGDLIWFVTLSLLITVYFQHSRYVGATL